MIGLLLFSLIPAALANLEFTLPTASTTCTGGQACQVQWQDNGQSPSLSSLGNIDIGIYVGSTTQQVQVQDGGFASATQGSLTININPGAGPNGNFYFVRAQSTSGSPINYSARFTLAGMTGTLPAGVNSTSTGSSSSPAGAAPAPAPPATSAPSSAKLTNAVVAAVAPSSSISVHSSSSAAPSSSSSGKTGGARGERVGVSMALLLSVLVTLALWAS